MTLLKKIWFQIRFPALAMVTLTACGTNPMIMPERLAQQPTQISTMASTRVVMHVVPLSGNGWAIKLRNNSQAISQHATKAAAIEAARQMAHQYPLAQVIVHLQNGQIEKEFTYGNDPGHIAG